MTTTSKPYWAFISYSSIDKKWGKWLHKSLENYPIPKEFHGLEFPDGTKLKKRLRPIFRDRDELAGSAELAPAILKGLRESRYLIVLCSPNSAKSKWVNKEIEDFRALAPGNDKRILALILDGSPNATTRDTTNSDQECFPPALRSPAEPLAGDLRKDADGKERGFLKVLAGITDIGFDKLYNRHQRAQRKKRIIFGTVAAVIIVALTSLSLYALNQKRIAEQQRAIALDTLVEARHQQSIKFIENGDYYGAMPFALEHSRLSPTSSAASALLFSLMAHHVPQAPLFEPIHLGNKPLSASVSRDGEELLTGGPGMPLQLWNLSSGKLTAQQHTSAMDIAPFSGFTPDGRGIYHLDFENFQLSIWDKLTFKNDPQHIIPIAMPGFMLPLTLEAEQIIWGMSGENSNLIADFITKAIPSEAPGFKDLKKSIAFGSAKEWSKAGAANYSNIDWHEVHQKPITSSDLTDDLTLFATGDEEGLIVIWDTQTGKVMRKFKAGDPTKVENLVEILKFSPNGEYLLVGTNAQTIQLFEVKTGNPRFSETLKFKKHYRFTAAAFSKDGKNFAIGDSNQKGSIYLWNVKETWNQDSPKKHHYYLGSPVLSLAFKDDGVYFYAASLGGRIKFFDYIESVSLGVNFNHQAILSKAGWNTDRSRYWTLDKAHTIRTYDSNFFGISCLKLPHRGKLIDLAYSPDGKELITVSKTAKGYFHQSWNSATWLPTHSPVPHKNPVKSIHFSQQPTKQLTIISEDSGILEQYDSRLGKLIKPPSNSTVGQGIKRSGLTLSSLSKDGNTLATSSIFINMSNIQNISPPTIANIVRAAKSMRNSKLIIQRKKKNAFIQQATINFKNIQLIDFDISQRGVKIIASALNSKFSTFEILLIVDNQVTQRLKIDALPKRVLFSPDASQAVVYTGDTGAVLINVPTMRVLAHLPHLNMVNASDFSPDGKMLVTASDDGSAKVWNTKDGKLIGKPLVHPPGTLVLTTQFSPDGKWIATGGTNDYVIIWEAQTGKRVSLPISSGDTINKLVFSPDGKWLAVASDNNQVRIWEWVGIASNPPPSLITSVATILSEQKVNAQGKLTPSITWPVDLRKKLEVLPAGAWKNALSAPFIPVSQRKITPSSPFTVPHNLIREALCWKKIENIKSVAIRVSLAKKYDPTIVIPSELRSFIEASEQK